MKISLYTISGIILMASLSNAISASSAVGPAIQGIIANSSPKDGALTMLTNKIIVPNSFPQTITQENLFSVSPKLPDPFTHWTNQVTYRNSNGDGCSVQFAWEVDTKSDVINAAPLTENSSCQVGDDGAIITIGTTAPSLETRK
jgi:hypothetical protein